MLNFFHVFKIIISTIKIATSGRGFLEGSLCFVLLFRLAAYYLAGKSTNNCFSHSL
jgi:hypothetical protein